MAVYPHDLLSLKGGTLRLFRDSAFATVVSSGIITNIKVTSMSIHIETENPSVQCVDTEYLQAETEKSENGIVRISHAALSLFADLVPVGIAIPEIPARRRHRETSMGLEINPALISGATSSEPAP